MTRAEAAVLGGRARAQSGTLHLASAAARAVNAKATSDRVARFAAYLAVSDSVKEAAWLARMPYRTARRYAKRLEQA